MATAMPPDRGIKRFLDHTGISRANFPGIGAGQLTHRGWIVAWEDGSGQTRASQTFGTEERAKRHKEGMRGTLCNLRVELEPRGEFNPRM